MTEGTAVSTVMSGNRAFWAEQQQIYATVDATQYRVQADSTIRVDGVDIALATGDPVSAIMAKINDSGAPVRATLDPVTGGMVLQSTQPHQIALADLGGATVLQDLGVLARGGSRPPLNTSQSARVFGGSIFDVVIHLRDSHARGQLREGGLLGPQGHRERHHDPRGHHRATWARRTRASRRWPRACRGRSPSWSGSTTGSAISTWPRPSRS